MSKKLSATDLISKAKNKTSDTYKISKKALTELKKIMEYNDNCRNPIYRVTKAEVVLLLEKYGWYGSVHSLNRLIQANFGRSFTGVSRND